MQNEKAALVTGGAARIGKEMSLNLAQKGYDIALHYNSSEKEALATRKLLLKTGVECELFAATFHHLMMQGTLFQKSQKDSPGSAFLLTTLQSSRMLVSATSLPNFWKTTWP